MNKYALIVKPMYDVFTYIKCSRYVLTKINYIFDKNYEK